jgi:hypothetical protein
MRAIDVKEHRKRHYNQMELVRKFRQRHQDDDFFWRTAWRMVIMIKTNDADDEDDRKPAAN